MSVGRYLRGEHLHVGTARSVYPDVEPTKRDQCQCILADAMVRRYLLASAHMRTYGYGGARNERKLRSMAIVCIGWAA